MMSLEKKSKQSATAKKVCQAGQ